MLHLCELRIALPDYSLEIQRIFWRNVRLCYPLLSPPPGHQSCIVGLFRPGFAVEKKLPHTLRYLICSLRIYITLWENVRLSPSQTYPIGCYLPFVIVLFGEYAIPLVARGVLLSCMYVVSWPGLVRKNISVPVY